MSDTDLDFVSDDEADLEDLRKLKAALADENNDPGTSQCFFNTKLSISDSLYDDISEIDTAFALNKLYDQKLQILETKLHNRLIECRQRLKALQNTVTVEKLTVPLFHPLICGNPYFKDKNGFPPPENKDTFLKKQTEMFDYSAMQPSPGWTVGNKNTFLSLMLAVSKQLKKQEFTAKINQLSFKAKTNAKFKTQIRKLKTELLEIKDKSLKELALPIDQEYDWNYIANKMTFKHKPHEYRALWKLFLHPSINTNVWSETEHKKLLQLAHISNYQGWESISKELNTGRTQFQCFIFFRSNTLKSQVTRKWSGEEEEYLKRLVDYYKIGNRIPWSKVAASMENRTKVQVYNKYLRLTEERKGRFIPEEDAIILTFVEKYGVDFKKMSWYLPGRSVAQCRVRYKVLLQRRISTVWTVEEDKKLLQLVANQDPPRNFAIIADYFPGKDRSMLRSRYSVLEKWIARYPNIDIVNAPRKPSREIKRGNSSNSFNNAIDNLKKRLELELYERRDKGLSIDSPEEKIEDAIISILVKEQIKIEEDNKLKVFRRTTDSDAKENCDHESSSEFSQDNKDGINIKNVKQILVLLRAKLNQKKFLHSSMSVKYPDLLMDYSNIFYASNKKSYSKKASTSSCIIIKNPDIWGKNPLDGNYFLLPPNYETITGCKTLMNSIRETQQINEVKSIKKYMKQNSIFKDSMHLLIKRFYILFIWPMLLSSHKPPTTLLSKQPEKPQESFPPTELKQEDSLVLRKELAKS